MLKEITTEWKGPHQSFRGGKLYRYFTCPKVGQVAVGFGFLRWQWKGFGGEREQGVVENLESFFLTLVAKWPLYAFNLCFCCLSGLN